MRRGLPLRNAAIVLPALMLAALPKAAQAQSDTQLWIGTGVTTHITGPLSFSLDAIARFSDGRDGLYQIATSAALGYRVAKGVTVTAGYVYSPNYSGGRISYTERRARQQIIVDSFAHLAGGTLGGRLRLEERWRDGSAGTGVRLRPQIRFTLPLHAHGKTALVLSHEAFLNLDSTGWGQARGLERIRSYAGISTPLAPGLRADFGYLEQHGFVRGGRDTDDNVGTFTLAWSL